MHTFVSDSERDRYILYCCSHLLPSPADAELAKVIVLVRDTGLPIGPNRYLSTMDYASQFGSSFIGDCPSAAPLSGVTRPAYEPH